MKGFIGAVLCVAAGCGGPADETDAVRAAYRDYEAALRAGNLDAVKARTTTARARELSNPEAPQLLELAAKMRPADAAVVTCRVEGVQATLSVRGTAEGRTMTGVATLLREQDGWRVDKEEWTLSMTVAAPAEAPAPPASMPAAVRAIVERVASADPGTGSKAWMDLGARYQSSAAFLREAAPALADERPVSFAVVEETFAGGGKKIRYFTASPTGGKGRQPAATVGEALRYHLWQYEDASGSGFKGTFAEWWPPYAARKGLPGGR